MRELLNGGKSGEIEGWRVVYDGVYLPKSLVLKS